ncbi:hypothetical protein [Streptomyces sp. MBT53]|uniref:hypothetical protein n=1 Tax=Streptomyces sp. MBT53 TaxID=1488384 RepID=UPI001913351C|nr:hypothetical protein [Streptomyces sp. MBT53]MBK6016206.1 hypothetical protein [Streptomyces sp. MBT53]
MSVTAAQGFSAAGIAAGIKAADGPDPAPVTDGEPSGATARAVTSDRPKTAPSTGHGHVVTDGASRADLPDSDGATVPVTLPTNDTAPAFPSGAASA